MAYNKTNWQTGDTITAEKLNNAEAGIDNAQWKEVGTAQLFSESVTTVEDEGVYFGTLAYSDDITADSLTVTFNGTEYNCTKQTFSGGGGTYYAYGGYGETGFDFSEYPFAIMSNNAGNTLATETAGTCTVSASASATTYTQAFSNAVTGMLQGTFRVTLTDNSGTWSSDKTFAEALAAHEAGMLVYAVIGSSESATVAYLDAVASNDHLRFVINNINPSAISQERYNLKANGTVTSTTITYSPS